MSVRTSRRRVIEVVAVADHVHDHDHDRVNEHGPWSLTLTYLDVNGDGDVNAEHLDAQELPHATT